MKVTSEKVEITPSEIVDWSEVENIRYSGDRIIFFLTGDRKVVVADPSPLMVDKIFRTYESYLKNQI